MNQRITINVCIPNTYVKQVMVHPLAPIHSLKLLMKPNEDPSYIYNGNELDPNSTFMENQICSSSSIICVKKTEIKDQWVKMTKDGIKFNECISSAVNPMTSLEAARLRDLRCQKAHSHFRTYHRLIASYKKREQENLPEQKSNLNLNFSSTLNEDPLPVPW